MTAWPPERDPEAPPAFGPRRLVEPTKPVMLPTAADLRRQTDPGFHGPIGWFEHLALWERLTTDQRLTVVRLMQDLAEGERGG